MVHVQSHLVDPHLTSRLRKPRTAAIVQYGIQGYPNTTVVHVLSYPSSYRVVISCLVQGEFLGLTSETPAFQLINYSR